MEITDQPLGDQLHRRETDQARNNELSLCLFLGGFPYLTLFFSFPCLSKPNMFQQLPLNFSKTRTVIILDYIFIYNHSYKTKL